MRAALCALWLLAALAAGGTPGEKINAGGTQESLDIGGAAAILTNSRADEGLAAAAGVLRQPACRVVAAAPELRWVVLDAGRAGGVRPGLMFALLRERRLVARVRVTDVRPRLSGAVVEMVDAETMFPAPGDRATLWMKETDRGP